MIKNVRVVSRHNTILKGMHSFVCANLVEHANHNDAAVHGHFSLQGREEWNVSRRQVSSSTSTPFCDSSYVLGKEWKEQYQSVTWH